MKGTKRRIIDPKRMKPKTVPIIERPKRRTGGKKTDPALLERAKNMFLSNATNTEIAEACQITLTTVGTWIKKGDWHHIRNAAMNIPKTSHKVVMKAYEDIDKEINNEKPNYEQIEKRSYPLRLQVQGFFHVRAADVLLLEGLLKWR